MSAPIGVSSSIPGYGSDSAALSQLAADFATVNGPPAFLIPTYMRAGKRYHVPWQVLAAINFIETDYGRDLSTSSAGAIGWMQFMPATWREYAVDAPHHKGKPNPYNPADAIFTAARYLEANGARHDIRGAVFAYNHATWYVDEVMLKAQQIRQTTIRAVPTAVIRRALGRTHVSARKRVAVVASDGLAVPPRNAPAAVKAMIYAGDSIAWLPYRFGGGHGTFRDTAYDCSGSLSFIFHAAGILNTTVTSGQLMGMGKPGPGRWVTIYANADHTFAVIAGVRFDTVALAESGSRWTNRPPDENLAGFVVRHPPGL